MVACLRNQSKKKHAHNIKHTKKQTKNSRIATNAGLSAKPIKTNMRIASKTSETSKKIKKKHTQPHIAAKWWLAC